MAADNGVRERKRASSASKTPTNPIILKEPAEALVPEGEQKPTWKRSAFRRRLRYIIWTLFAISLTLYIAQYFGYLKSKSVRRPSRVDDLASWEPYFPPPEEVVTTADVEKRNAIVAAFKNAWAAYEADAFGSDEYHPISHTGSNLSADGGIGYMIIDSLDTMVLMGLEEEYARAREWVESGLSFERGGKQNVFEVTIRVLGGLLSTYALKNDPLYLRRAEELAALLLPAFDTPSGIPLTLIDLKERKGHADVDNSRLSGTAEATTLQLEFKYLAELTGEEEWWTLVEKVMGVVKRAMRQNVVPIFISPDTGEFHISQVRLGSRGDSYYEYLLKQYLQTDRSEPVYRQMYEAAMTEIDQFLIHKTVKSNLTFTAEMHPYRGPNGELNWRLMAKQDHLACFLAGSLLLGVTEGQQPVPPDPSTWTTEDKRDWRTGVELVKTCMATHETATGLAPEIAMFYDVNHPKAQEADWYVKHGKDGSAILDGRYILRPETIESLFLAFRLTGDQRYRDWGWQIFQSIEQHCRLPSGAYASVKDVETLPVEWEDKMETFMMSETLKYLFLLFSDASILPLNEWVFNTEAHPFPVFSPSFKTGIA
ncbi:glycoside hydrolase family 47 protein [Calocera viscosa TUFC12733]|uniref:alpha-1,2-Mannosidase n=1 Tax=Calocera viscosa (strain TUFC12733) TaxID=1330018 RepID=A0A167M8W6_CALVF|nr:glycoside hydrolase family 47 protein [Calocera viscosa TUFC12733]